MNNLVTPAGMTATLCLCLGLVACNDGNESATVASTDTATTTDNSEQGNAGTPGVLHNAYLSFTGNVTVALDGNEVVIEATGQPDHTSPYWNPINGSGLYIEPDPTITTEARISPRFIEEYNNLYSLRVPTSPKLATSASSTSLGAVGFSVSGAPIFNDQERPKVDLAIGVISGFNRSGGHTGPETYHYHLEPKAISNDDEELIGIIADGFFIYGRRCFEDPSAYPTDLDVSGGHFSQTQHSNGV
ncbi:MAG: YHYH protein [Gammaproteobacteria bacterium]